MSSPVTLELQAKLAEWRRSSLIRLERNPGFRETTYDAQPNADDARFNDPIWSESPNWDMVKDWYLAFTHRAQDMLYDTPGLSSKDRRRAAFWWRKWLNAVAPTNYFWTNPIAIRKAFETRGESLSRGWNNFLEDAQAGNHSLAIGMSSGSPTPRGTAVVSSESPTP